MESTKDRGDHGVLTMGISLEESQSKYQKWGEKGDYDEFMGDPSRYLGPKAIKQAIQSVDLKKDAPILDIGAGTGLAGQVAIDLGYTNLHALEPNTALRDTAQAKGIYSKILPEFIGGEVPVSQPDDTYDAIISCGAFGPGHIPSTAVPEMIRLVKSGGYIIIVMRKEFLTIHPDYRDNMVPLMEKLVQDKTWELISWTTYEQHFDGKDGLAIIYRVC